MLRRTLGQRTSTLELLLGPFRIEIRVSSQFTNRNRRVLLLQCFRALKPLLLGLRESRIVHWDGHPFNWIWNEKRRPIEDSPVLSLKTQAERRGYFFRLRRLELGLRLEDFAMIANVNGSHLSLIERGRVIPRPSTVRKLERAFQSRTPGIHETKASPKPDTTGRGRKPSKRDDFPWPSWAGPRPKNWPWEMPDFTALAPPPPGEAQGFPVPSKEHEN
jgi:hypothetical protein